MGARIKIKLFVLLAFAMPLVSCLNPTASITNHKKDLLSRYSKNIYRYENTNRSMQAIWTGDPQKRPLVFVHGSPGSFDSWSEFMVDPDLQSRFHMIAVDRPGYGGSGYGIAETSLNKQAEDIAAVLQFNESGLPAILVGHSFGGPVIAQIAVNNPTQIAGLVFVAASVDPNLEDFKWYQNFALWRLTRWLVPTELVVCNEEIMTLKKELEQLATGWKNIRSLAFVIHGEEDNLVPAANADYIQNQLKHLNFIKIEKIKNLNHFVPWKRPDLIFKAIADINNNINYFLK